MNSVDAGETSVAEAEGVLGNRGIDGAARKRIVGMGLSEFESLFSELKTIKAQ